MARCCRVSALDYVSCAGFEVIWAGVNVHFATDIDDPRGFLAGGYGVRSRVNVVLMSGPYTPGACDGVC